MGRYSAGGRLSATVTVSGGVGAQVGMPVAQLWNPSSTDPIFLREFRYHRTVATAGGPLALMRTTVRGTSPGTTVTPDIDNDYDKALAPPSGAVVELGLWAGQWPGAGTLTVTDRGTVQSKAGGTTLVFSPASNFAAGTLAVISLANDNAGTGGAGVISGVTDSKGNTWTNRGTTTNDPGLVNEGVEEGKFAAPMGTTPVLTSDTITVTYSTGPAARCATLVEIASSNGGLPFFQEEAAGTGSGTSVARPGSGNERIGDAVIGSVLTEGVATFTGDADTDGGAWSTLQTTATSGGVDNTNIGIATQWKVLNATISQAINMTLSVSQDWVAALSRYRPPVVVKALERYQTASVIGHGPNGWIFDAPGIEVPPASGIVVVSGTAQDTQIGDVTFTWDEGRVDDAPSAQVRYI